MVTDVTKNLGYKLRSMRCERRMSQDDFALIVGIDRTYISSIERGERNVSVETLVKYCAAFGMSLSELMVGVEDFDYVEYYLTTVEPEFKEYCRSKRKSDYAAKMMLGGGEN